MYKRGRTWWTHIKFNGKNIQRSLGTTDKKLARAIESEIRIEIIEGNYFNKPAGEKKTVRDMMERFLKEHGPKVSINTQNAYKAYLTQLLPFFGELILTAVTQKTIAEYKVLRYGEGVKPATINRELAMLSKAFSLAVNDWAWLCENPVSKVAKENEDNERGRWLSQDEEEKLLACSPEWLKDIIIFDLNTGLRQDELLSLEWSRTDLFRKTIIIQKTKNKKPKTVPLNQKALNVLMNKSNVRSIQNDLVFFNDNGCKIDRFYLAREFNKALKKAGITDFKFHDLRHTFATCLAQKGVDLYKISKLLGHRNITMTQRYAHHCPESLKESVAILDETGYNLATIQQNNCVKVS